MNPYAMITATSNGQIYFNAVVPPLRAPSMNLPSHFVSNESPLRFFKSYIEDNNFMADLESFRNYKWVCEYPDNWPLEAGEDCKPHKETPRKLLISVYKLLVL